MDQVELGVFGEFLQLFDLVRVRYANDTLSWLSFLNVVDLDDPDGSLVGQWRCLGRTNIMLSFFD
ncbi:MAG: hypothetical protein OXC82_10360 [Rhodobacteraceae bacterium]|nr:hypothetical protein [Paracoccaceae bacterium]MCY4250817.1 hypothetical protein [Paracoccaceae bacterium]MCY4306835.1 hypothetical protein [Paracoccaceae bacterium]